MTLARSFGVAFMGFVALVQSAPAVTVAYYRFGEATAGTAASATAGAVLDSSGNGINATAVNGPTYSGSVPANPLAGGQPNPTSLSFNGTTQRVLVPNDPKLAITKSLTLEAFVYLNSAAGNGTSVGNIIFRGDDYAAYDPYRLTVNYNAAGTPTLDFAVTATDVIKGQIMAKVTANLPVRQWVHVAGTLDDATGNLSLYINNALAASTTTTVRPFGTLDGPNPGVGIGALQNNAEYFYGLIDEVRISNAALTPAQFLTSVPEPAALSSIAAGGLLALCIRRRVAT